MEYYIEIKDYTKTEKVVKERNQASTKYLGKNKVKLKD